MKTKILTAAILVGISSLANAEPLPVPSIYNKGPATPILNTTDMRVEEKTAFSLMEAMMQTTESYVYAATNCPSLSVDVEVYSHSDSATHYIEDNLYGGLRLNATPQTAVAHYGQAIDVKQAYKNGALEARWNSRPIKNAKGLYVFNDVNNMMVNEKFGAQVKGQNIALDQFYGSVIKDFYYGNTFLSTGQREVIYDYGLQALTKAGYPVNKWWQRSVSVRDDGQPACTVFQKDRLVGSSACRIVLSTTGYNQDGLFWQKGKLTVAKVTPTNADGTSNSTELDSCVLTTGVIPEPGN